jgi:hypothetical protein
MPEVEWFRRTTWTDRDRDEFNARLSRSRGIGNKAQYLGFKPATLPTPDLMPPQSN